MVRFCGCLVSTRGWEGNWYSSARGWRERLSIELSIATWLRRIPRSPAKDNTAAAIPKIPTPAATAIIASRNRHHIGRQAHLCRGQHQAQKAGEEEDYSGSRFLIARPERFISLRQLPFISHHKQLVVSRHLPLIQKLRKPGSCFLVVLGQSQHARSKQRSTQHQDDTSLCQHPEGAELIGMKSQ